MITRLNPRIYPLLACLSVFPVVAEAVLYRWVDDDGIVHYTDTLPPSSVKRARTEFSPQGIPIHRVPRAKTPEEIRQARELKRLRAYQQKLLEKLRAADRVLLRTFRSEDDLLRARDGKLETIDLMIRVTRSNIDRQEGWLEELRAQAADFERVGKPVSKHLRSLIQKTEASIRKGYALIAEREKQKAAVREKFRKDLARFRQLTQAKTRIGQLESQDLQPVRHEVIPCKDPQECASLWKRAEGYLDRGDAFEMQTDEAKEILVIAPWRRSHQVNLILTKVPDPEGTGASLLLDLRCPVNIRGEERCQNPTLLRMVEGFRKAVLGDHRSQAAFLSGGT